MREPGLPGDPTPLASQRPPPARSASLALLLACAALGCAADGDPTHGAMRLDLRRTPDGLVEYERPLRGTLYLAPSHGISLHHAYLLSQVVLSYESDSLRLFDSEEQRIREHVAEGFTQRLRDRGVRVVDEAGPCTLSMGIGVVDIAVHPGTENTQSTNMLASWGALTLVVDLRDAATGEPLARYGRRLALPGGIQWQDGHPPWKDVQRVLDKLLGDTRRVMTDLVPTTGVPDPACAPPAAAPPGRDAPAATAPAAAASRARA